MEQYSINPRESNMIEEKKSGLTKDICQLLSKYKIDYEFKKYKRIESFVEDILLTKYQS